VWCQSTPRRTPEWEAAHAGLEDDAPGGTGERVPVPWAAVATRMIVTSQPDIACDVCGRRLLRGEQPDVFLAGGQRRTVCELCAPRATHEGWLREVDQGRSVSLPPARARRGRNLLGRLRQLREPVAEPAPVSESAFGGSPVDDLGEVGSYELFDGGVDIDGEGSSGEIAARASGLERTEPAGALAQPAATARPVPAVPVSDADAEQAPSDGALRGDDVKAQRALEVFNAGEHPRRVAGVARSLGAPSVAVRPLSESSSTVAIVVAWELSWYRYEVDLGDEAAGASVVAQGTELGELAAEDRLANAAASDDGALSLVG